MKRGKTPGGGESIARQTEDDVEGHKLALPSVARGKSIARQTEDDVEGHNIGSGHPLLAHDLLRARERDIQREASRNLLASEAKRASKRKG
jgi:hypothetical protein